MSSDIDFKLVEKEVGSKIKSKNEVENNGFELEFKDGTEYLVFPSYDDAESYATTRVSDDLENEPEIFSQDWLGSFIDKDNLKDQLWDDVHSSNDSYWNDIKDEDDEEYQNRQIAELVEGGFLDEGDVKNEKGKLIKEDKLDQEKIDSAIENAINDKTDEDLEDPMEYLRDIYGDDASKEAIRIGGIDYAEASESAIITDGVAHFLSGYDGNEIELENGNVLYRTN